MQNLSTIGVPKKGLPEGFVYIDELIGDCIIDAKYFGTDNFIGRQIDGYEQPLVVMSSEVAEKCVKAAKILREEGYLMKFFDSYRPQRAVDNFVRWAADPLDQRRKPINYPEIDKKDVFKLGYIAKKSMHTRGLAVDMTIVDMKTHQEIEVGACFDYMGSRSHVITDEITPLQEANRQIMRKAMLAAGFETYPEEWWHFNVPLKEHQKEVFYDFPVA
jgi:D-alanyl-D-alanine dipeptidase